MTNPIVPIIINPKAHCFAIVKNSLYVKYLFYLCCLVSRNLL